MRPRGKPADLERRRAEALKLLREGMSAIQVADRLGVDRVSVHRWAVAGPRGIKARPNTGRPPKLEAEERKELERILFGGAEAQGYGTDLWTCPRIVEVIRRHFDVEYHADHVGRLLRGLGWSPQKPQRRAIERDEKAIRTWVKHDWPRIKKKRSS